MKFVKLIDLALQVFLFVSGCIWAISQPQTVLYAYFLLGGLQVLSLLIHLTRSEHYYPVKDRKAYAFTLLFLIPTGLLCLPVILYFLYGLLIVSPLLAIWYMTICYREYNTLDKKEFIHLK